MSYQTNNPDDATCSCGGCGCILLLLSLVMLVFYQSFAGAALRILSMLGAAGG